FSSASEVMFALGIESHLAQLSNCLTTKPLGIKDSKSTHSFEENYHSYSPPFSRTAVAIREWKAKLEARKSRRNYKPYSSMA
ncbi:MAG: serine/threonine protein kinase, partial [Cyanobacteria bacterium P01_D01_bin.116]